MSFRQTSSRASRRLAPPSSAAGLSSRSCSFQQTQSGDYYTARLLHYYANHITRLLHYWDLHLGAPAVDECEAVRPITELLHYCTITCPHYYTTALHAGPLSRSFRSQRTRSGACFLGGRASLRPSLRFSCTPPSTTTLHPYCPPQTRRLFPPSPHSLPTFTHPQTHRHLSTPTAPTVGAL